MDMLIASSFGEHLQSALVLLAQHLAEAGIIDAPGAQVVASQVIILEGATGVGVYAHGMARVAVDAVVTGDGIAVAHDRQAAAGMGDDLIVLQGDDASATEEDSPSAAIVDTVAAQQSLLTGGDVDTCASGLGTDITADHLDVATGDDEAVEMLAAELAQGQALQPCAGSINAQHTGAHTLDHHRAKLTLPDQRQRLIYYQFLGVVAGCDLDAVAILRAKDCGSDSGKLARRTVHEQRSWSCARLRLYGLRHSSRANTQSTAQFIQPGTLWLVSSIHKEVRIVEWLRFVPGIEDQVDQHARIITHAMRPRLETAKCAAFQLYPVGALRGGGADADENVALGDSALDTLREVVARAELLRIKPVVHIPGIERGEQWSAARIVVMRMANEDPAVAAHHHPQTRSSLQRVMSYAGWLHLLG